MMRNAIAASLLLLLGVGSLARAEDPSGSAPGFGTALKLDREFEIGGRKAFRYTRASQQGAAVPFYVVPADGTIPNPPLHVVLHHAGGSADQAIQEAFAEKHRHQYVAKEHCALYLDCRTLGGDWWWGWKAIEQDKALYTNQLQEVEQRVLDTVEWVIKDQKIDRNRVYLSGRSMGGSGSLGIGYTHGDIFAAILVNVPAGADHVLFRVENLSFPDPPPTIGRRNSSPIARRTGYR
jgi:hypothetical protein